MPNPRLMLTVARNLDHLLRILAMSSAKDLKSGYAKRYLTNSRSGDGSLLSGFHFGVGEKAQQHLVKADPTQADNTF
jgi:hypothetical protein